MIRLKSMIRNAFIGGVVVLLPMAILGLFFRAVFRFVTELIQPITNVVAKTTGSPELLSSFSVLLIILLVCVAVGYLTSTSVGIYMHSVFDNKLKVFAPGYKMIKEIVNQLFGDKANSPFSSGSVAEVKVFGESVPTTVTAIVTSRHADGRMTVFVPTGPNPTSGFIYHVDASLVRMLTGVKAETALKTIISCGAGSAELLGSQSTKSVEQAEKMP